MWSAIKKKYKEMLLVRQSHQEHANRAHKWKMFGDI